MAILKKERVPAFVIEEKYVDALLEICSPLLPLELALLVIIGRFEKVPAVWELSQMIQYPEIEIECALRRLSDIGLISLG